MTVNTHIETLSEKHAKLEQKIHQAYNHHDSDTEVSSLKRRRLKIKDEIKKLETV